MSDVLRRLALRGLGQADEIRPRTPSLYGGGGAWLESEVADAGPSLQPLALSPPPAPLAPSSVPVPQVAAAAAVGSQPDPALPAFAMPTITAAPAMPAIQRKVGTPAERSRPDAPSVPANAPSLAPTLLRPPQTEAQPAPTHASPFIDEAPADRTSPRSFTPAPLLPDLAFTPVPYEPPRFDPPLRPPPSAGAPDIRISIGRVEVRTDPPERRPQPRPAPRASPFMSLEEYLGGAKGRRR